MVNSEGEIEINVITPVGTIDGLYDTMSSVSNVANLIKINFNHILILNNNTDPTICFKKTKNYKYIIININPVASRSTARNVGLISMDSKPYSFTIFIDAGDTLLESAIIKLSKLQIKVHMGNYMIVAQTYINFSEKFFRSCIPK